VQDFATIHGIFRYKNHADIRDVLEAQRCSAADGQIGLPDEAPGFSGPGLPNQLLTKN